VFVCVYVARREREPLPNPTQSGVRIQHSAGHGCSGSAVGRSGGQRACKSTTKRNLVTQSVCAAIL
jgi:hypothetical protein